MNPVFDVLVVGGGIVGLSAAIAMKQSGLSVALIDAGELQVNTHQSDPRVYAINQASQSLFQRLGVWDCLDRARLSPYTHMHVWDAANHASIDFDSRMVASDRLGTIIEESVIKEALLKRLKTQDIRVLTQHRVNSIQSMPEHVEIGTDQGTWPAKLLIVADGALSASRQLLGVGLTTWPYHQQAIVALIRTDKAHQKTAYQVFNSDGPLAFLPMADPHLCSIVWSTTSRRSGLLMDLSEDAFAAALTDAFEGHLGACRLEGKRYAFPLHMRHAEQYSGERWLLMGDAAHTIHPLAGLGLNVGLADLSSWLAHLGAHPSQFASKKILGAYQRERKYEVWQMVALMEGLKAIFANPLPPIAALRGLGLRACDHLLPLKRLFIGQAAM
jgi:2-octaprenylphenol hydroxylase